MLKRSWGWKIERRNAVFKEDICGSILDHVITIKILNCLRTKIIHITPTSEKKNITLQ